MFSKDIKILIVDDMMTMRKLVRKTLADIGFTNVAEADDGATAWPKLEDALQLKQPFQMVISDWNMPKMKGIELLKKVRGTEGMKDIPFLLLTAEAEKGQIVEAVQAGVSNYITKPFSPAILQQKLEAVWEKIVTSK